MTTDRIYQGADDQWYFNVRGNLAKGPFVTHHDAEDALNQHVSHCYRPHNPPNWPKALRALRIGRRWTSEARHSDRVAR